MAWPGTWGISLLLLVPLAIGDREGTLLEGRTPQMVQAVLDSIEGIGDCHRVTPGHLASVRHLDLSGRGIDSLSPRDLEGLSGLLTLSLQDNRIVRLPRGFLAHTPRLERLYLGYNRLESLEPSLLRDLPRLRTLWLNDNRLESLPEPLLERNIELDSLHLSANRLTRLAPSVFAGLSRLRLLRIDGNRLAVLPDLTPLRSLEDLDLSGNLLASLSDTPFAGMARLRSLDLSDNRLSRLASLQCAGLENLHRLDLGRNRLGAMNIRLPEDLPRLESLNLESNRLASLPDWGTGRLRILALEGNPLRHELRITPFPHTLDEGTVTRYSLSLFTPPGEAVTVTPHDPSGRVEFDPPSLRFTGEDWAVPREIAIRAELDRDTRTEHVRISHRLRYGTASRTAFLHLELAVEDRAPGRLVLRNSPLDGRNRKVVGAILAQIGNVNDVREVTEAHLESITQLQLSSLDLLELRRNDLAGLINLQWLYLARNLLTRLPGDLFDGLGKLEVVHLDNNLLEHLPARLLRGLSGLKTLGLASNRISGLPADLLGDLEKLQSLRLNNNRIESIPDGFLDPCRELRILHLANNRLTALPPDLLRGLDRLEQLDLGHNRLTGAGCGPLPPLAALTNLDLGHNRIESLPSGCFAGLSSLVILDLSGNPLTALPGGHDDALPSLATLRLEDISLQRELGYGTLHPRVLQGGSTTYALWPHAIPDASFTVIPECGVPGIAFEPGQLRFAPRDGREPRLVTVHVPPGVEPGRVRLRHRILHPRGERSSAIVPTLSVMEAEPLLDCPGSLLHGRTKKVALAILARFEDLEDCKDIDRKHLETFTSLSLSGKDIRSLIRKDFEGFSRLSTLHLSRNRLTELPPELFADLPRLSNLYLDNNDLTRLPPDLLADVPDLISLRLNGNRLHQAPRFAHSASLRYLYLASNDLVRLPEDPFGEMKELMRLDLSSNRLSRLPSRAFSGMAKLTILNLHGNRLSGIPPGSFDGMESLGSLILARNRIGKLPSDLFAGLTRINYLDCSGNPLVHEIRMDAAFLGLDEGSVDSYSISLHSAPEHAVRVSPVPDSGLTVTPSFLVFTPENWDTIRKVEVKAGSSGPDRKSFITHRIDHGPLSFESVFRLRIDIRDMDIRRGICRGLLAPPVPSPGNRPKGPGSMVLR